MKKIISVFYLLFFAVVFSYTAFAKTPSVSAKSFVIIDGDTGKVIASKDENLHLPMASTTKIMTAICVIENADISEVISVPKEACGIEGSSLYLTPNRIISVKDLLYGIMLRSANDGAVALAIHTSGSIENFASLMNFTAEKIGMNNSCFKNPNGLGQKGHYSSAYDLAILMQYAMKNEVFRTITETKNYTVSYDESEKQPISNHNRLLSLYQYCTGGKTGFTSEAGRCLVTSAEKNGKRLICVTLNDGNDWNDHKSLYEWAFSLYAEKEIAKIQELSYELPLCGGVKESVKITNLDSVSLTVLTDDEITVSYELPHFLYAPTFGFQMCETDEIKVMEPVGYAKFYQCGACVGSVPLYAVESVERYHEPTFFEKIKAFFISIWKKITE